MARLWKLESEGNTNNRKATKSPRRSGRRARKPGQRKHRHPSSSSRKHRRSSSDKVDGFKAKQEAEAEKTKEGKGTASLAAYVERNGSA